MERALLSARRLGRAALTAALVAGALVAGAPTANAASPAHNWSMDEAAGTGTMLDAGSPATNGSWQNITAGVAGFSGTAYRFSGNSRVTVADDASLDPGSDTFTATVHVRFTRMPDASNGGDYDLIRKGLGSTSGGYWKIEIYPNSKHTVAQGLCQMKGSSNSIKIVGTPYSLNDDQWHTLTCTKTNTDVTLTVDGHSYKKTVTIGSIANATDLTLGAKPGSGGDWYTGDMDQVTYQIGASTPAPTVTGFTPTSGPVGTSVTITGTNLTGASSVKFNGRSATTYTVDSSTQITATVPSGATTGKISVTTAGGTATSSSDFTVIPPPSVTGFTPTSGPPGTSVTITGTGFTGVSDVAFNGTSVPSGDYTVDSATQITAKVPSGASTGKISVTTPNGTGQSASDFTVTVPPTITGFSPTSGWPGVSVTITGTNFTGATDVAFNGTSVGAGNYSVDSNTQITAVVPSGATTGKITVTTPVDIATSVDDFTVTPEPIPTITSFSPTAGPVGTSVTINGSAFTGTAAVAFGTTAAATFSVDSDTRITATVPSGALTGPITVTNPTGPGTSTGIFTVTTASAISEVQKKHAIANDVSISATLPSAPSAGDVLVAVVTVGQAASPAFDTPSGWTSAFAPARGAMFWKVSDGSEQTVTVNLSAGQTAKVLRMWVVELAGVSTTNPVDQTGSAIFTTQVTSVTPTTSGSTAQANEWAIAAVSVNGDNGGGNAATNGFTVFSATDNRDVAASSILGSTSTVSTTISWTTARAGAWMIATFRGA